MVVLSQDHNENLSRQKIPVPPLKEQERNAHSVPLDTFCNDLTSGLPAEIKRLGAGNMNITGTSY